MAFYGYGGDVGECYWTPYSISNYEYNVVSSRDLLSYYSDDFTEPKLAGYDSNYSEYNSYAAHPEVSYSIHSFSEPKVIQYEPASNDSGYLFSETTYRISYSTSESTESVLEFDEIKFDEYDPTPYDGGYDPDITYGRPLPPSDEICYPRSTAVPNGKSLDGFSYASIPSPYGDQEADSKKSQGGKEESSSQDQQVSQAESEGKVDDECGDGKEEDEEKQLAIIPGDDYPSRDRDLDFSNGVIGEYGYDYEYQVPQIPYGSGLEAMDICESLFGYWPCLAKRNRQIRTCNCQIRYEDTNTNPWQSAADYLFGGPFGYGEGKDAGYGEYAYESSCKQ